MNYLDFPQDYQTDEYGELELDNLGNPILLEEEPLGDQLGPGQCILPAELQLDGNYKLSLKKHQNFLDYSDFFFALQYIKN